MGNDGESGGPLQTRDQQVDPVVSVAVVAEDGTHSKPLVDCAARRLQRQPSIHMLFRTFDG